MRIECKASDLHDRIDEAWEGGDRMIKVMLVSEETGEKTFCGEVGPEDAWWSVPLPPCPACNGPVVWAEAGQVPGTRRCAECKRFYRLRTRKPTCTECGQAHSGWCPSLEPGHPATCPECDGTNVSESGICFDCQASDYREEK